MEDSRLFIIMIYQQHTSGIVKKMISGGLLIHQKPLIIIEKGLCSFLRSLVFLVD